MTTPPARAAPDEEVRAAIAASHLSDVPAHVVSEVFARSRRVRPRAGRTLRVEGEPGPHVELVVGGLIRIFVTAPDGRTFTARYCRSGALMGAVSLFAPGYAMPGTIQALTDTDIISLDAARFVSIVEREPTMQLAMIRELAERVVSYIAEMRDGHFATVRQRVARHLLDLASEHQRGAALVAPISQQELAEAVGSVREVVVRALRDLRQEGVLSTGRGRIAVVDPDALLNEMFQGTWRPDFPRTGT